MLNTLPPAEKFDEEMEEGKTEDCQRLKYGTKCSLSGAWGVGVGCRWSELSQLMRECARTCQVDVDG